MQLTNTEKSVLSEGLKFALTRNKVSFVEHFLPFEKLLKPLDEYDIYNIDEGTNFFNTSVKKISFNYVL